jgi:hypothetical protein
MLTFRWIAWRWMPSAVPSEMISTLMTKPIMRQAWGSIKTMRVGGERVCRVSTQKLRRGYKQLAFYDGKLVEDFAMQLTSLTNQLAILGDAELDDKIVAKYLCVARPRYQQLVISIKTLLDIDDLFVEEITTHQKYVEDDGGISGVRW